MFSIFSLWARTNLVVPLLLVGLLKLLKLLVALGASWGLPRPLAEPWLGALGPGAYCWGSLTQGLGRSLGLGGPWPGPLADTDLLAGKPLARQALGRHPWRLRGALGPGGPWPVSWGGPWPGTLGPGVLARLARRGPWPGGPLARGALGPGGPWIGPMGRGALGALGPGALGPGGPALGPGGPWPGGPLARGALGSGALEIREKAPKITKLSNQPAWTPRQPPGQESSYQGPGGPGGGGPDKP